MLMSGKHLSNYDISFVNSIDRYGFEIVARQVLCLLFGELEESTMVKAATFLDQLARHIKFAREVIAKRQGKVFEASTDSGSSNPEAFPIKKGKKSTKKSKVDKSEEERRKGLYTLASLLMEFLLGGNRYYFKYQTRRRAK